MQHLFGFLLFLLVDYYLHDPEYLWLSEILEPFSGNYKDHGYTANVCVAAAGNLSHDDCISL
jgi:hypothetical protein